MLPDLSIIIVNWNTKEYLLSCLDSIVRCLSAFSKEVIVVDNASSDGSCDTVKTNYAEVSLVASTVNNGFAWGVNEGIRRSQGKYILILNPDIVLQPEAIEKLISFFESHADAGALMPMLMNADGVFQKGYVRKIPTLFQVIFFHTFFEPWSRKIQWLVERFLEAPLQDEEYSEVEQIPGACILVRRSVIVAVGLMDEEYKLFFEDVDWSLRMRRAGWKLVLYRKAALTHVGGRSFVSKNNEWVFERFTLSLILFFKKNRSKLSAFFVELVLVCNSGIIYLIRSITVAGNNAFESAAYSKRKHKLFLKSFYTMFVRHRGVPLHAGR